MSGDLSEPGSQSSDEEELNELRALQQELAALRHVLGDTYHQVHAWKGCLCRVCGCMLHCRSLLFGGGQRVLHGPPLPCKLPLTMARRSHAGCS